MDEIEDEHHLDPGRSIVAVRCLTRSVRAGIDPFQGRHCAHACGHITDASLPLSGQASPLPRGVIEETCRHLVKAHGHTGHRSRLRTAEAVRTRLCALLRRSCRYGASGLARRSARRALRRIVQQRYYLARTALRDIFFARPDQVADRDPIRVFVLPDRHPLHIRFSKEALGGSIPISCARPGIRSCIRDRRAAHGREHPARGPRARR